MSHRGKKRKTHGKKEEGCNSGRNLKECGGALGPRALIPPPSPPSIPPGAPPTPPPNKKTSLYIIPPSPPPQPPPPRADPIKQNNQPKPLGRRQKHPGGTIFP
ncbi:hypothetical protein DSO57_1018408 [Entomophthora muscae]|uniref:Uncharacterized protein n=1 Tax=Entomophthora muscae TaxID=34485 RepID=A0ACC2STG7_9FUNG|nr:hypothetical protein DSO57_1018408 [Entomophthora muscae]